MFNRSLFESGYDIHPLFFEQDGNTDITGDWIKFRNYERAYVLLIKAGSEDVDTGSIAFLQATDNAAAGSKALNCRRCWYKTGTMTGQGTWTEVIVGDATPPVPDDSLAFGSSVTAGSTRVVADVNTDPLYLLCELLAEDMDNDGGFDFFTAFIEGDEVNNTVLYSALAILANGSYPQRVPLTPLS